MIKKDLEFAIQNYKNPGMGRSFVLIEKGTNETVESVTELIKTYQVDISEIQVNYLPPFNSIVVWLQGPEKLHNEDIKNFIGYLDSSILTRNRACLYRSFYFRGAEKKDVLAFLLDYGFAPWNSSDWRFSPTSSWGIKMNEDGIITNLVFAVNRDVKHYYKDSILIYLVESSFSSLGVQVKLLSPKNLINIANKTRTELLLDILGF
jgi:hypothetical protein